MVHKTSKRFYLRYPREVLLCEGVRRTRYQGIHSLCGKLSIFHLTVIHRTEEKKQKKNVI